VCISSKSYRSIDLRKMKKIAVFGATGMLGKPVAE
jgi:hypothetical protein